MPIPAPLASLDGQAASVKQESLVLEPAP